LNRETSRELIDRFIAAYNAFDIEGMLTLLAPNIRFENYSGDTLTAFATGIDQFRQLAEQSQATFSERQQRVVSLEFYKDSVIAAIWYRGRLAVPLPNGPAADTILEMEGHSEYSFASDNRIAKIIDRS